MSDLVAQNKRRAVVLVATFVAVIAAVLGLLLVLAIGVLGLVVAVVVAGGAAVVAYRTSEDVALRRSRAEPADLTQFARLHNLVEGLCVASGLPKPRVFVVDDPAPNAFSVGRSRRHASIAVTSGLLDTLDRIELEGVLAHELSHIKNDDIVAATLAVTMVGFLAGVPVLGKLHQMAVEGRREELADVSAVEITRYPPGLIAALEKLRDGATVVSSGSRATAHLWIATAVAASDPAGASAAPDRSEGHPPLDERIAALLEL